MSKSMPDADWRAHDIMTKRAYEAEAEVERLQGYLVRRSELLQEKIFDIYNLRDHINRLREALEKINGAYEIYRGRGVIPAPDKYQSLVEAIKEGEEVLAKLEKWDE